jgi:hypothetical protein
MRRTSFWDTKSYEWIRWRKSIDEVSSCCSSRAREGKKIEEELTELNSQQHALIYLPSSTSPHSSIELQLYMFHSLPTPVLVLFLPVEQSSPTDLRSSTLGVPIHQVPKRIP